MNLDGGNDPPADEPYRGEDELVRSIPLAGELARGQAVVLGWPEPDELDRITGLRNGPQTQPWFLDRRTLDPEANRRFLSEGLAKPFESILAVRWLQDGSFLGSIGWMDWRPAARKIALGRLMVDHKAVLAVGSRFPPGYQGVAADAARTLGEFVFEVMKVRFISYCYLEQNPRARRVAESGGLVVLDRRVETTADGRRLVLIEARIPEESGGWLRGGG